MFATRWQLSILLVFVYLMCLVEGNTNVLAQTKEETSRAAPNAGDSPEQLKQRVSQLRTEAEKLYFAGKFTESLQRYKELLVVEQQVYPQDQFPKGHVEIADTFLAIGQNHGQLGDVAQEIAHYESAIAMVRELPDGKDELVTYLTELAATYGGIRNYAKNELHLKEAEQLARQFYPADKFPDGHPQIADIDHQFGHLLRSQGKLDASAARFENAVRICRTYCATHPDPTSDNDTDRAYTIYIRAVRELGNSKLYRGQLTDAAALYEECTNVQRRVYDLKQFPNGHPLLAASLEQTASIYMRQAKHREAVKLLEQALAMADALTKEGRNVEKLAVQCLCDLARTNEEVGQIDLGLQQSKTALERMRRYSAIDSMPTNQAFLGMALRIHGQLLSAKGDLDQARIHIEEAIELQRQFAEKTSNPDEHRKVAIGLHELALLLRQQGEYGRAKDRVMEAVEVYSQLFPTEKFPDGHPELAAILIGLGVVSRDNRDYDKAFEAFLKAEQIWGKLAKRDPAGINERSWAISLENLGEIYCMRSELDKAREMFDRSQKIFQSLYRPEQFPKGHPDLALSQRRIGRFHRLCGNTDEAVKCTSTALNMARAIYPIEVLPNGHESVLGALKDHADALYDHGDIKASVETGLLAVQMNQQLADQIIPGLSEAECLNYVSEKLSVPTSLIPAWKKADRPVDDLYDLIWKQRAIVLRTIEARQVAVRRSKSDEVNALLEQQRQIGRRLGGLLRSSLGKGATGKSTNDELALLTNRKEELERELTRKIPEYKTITDRFHVTPDDLKRSLLQDVAYVEFLTYPIQLATSEIKSRRYVAFVIQPDKSIQFQDLGDSTTIEPAVVRFRQTIIENDNLSEAGVELRKLIWAPIEACLARDVKSIYLCPDGVLSAVPWAALPSRRNESVLLHDYGLAVVPCGQYFCNWLRGGEKKEVASGKLLAIGDIDYNLNGQRDEKSDFSKPIALAVRGDDPFAFGPLAGTREEIDFLTHIVGESKVTVLRGMHASTSNVIEQLPNARWAHFATHGFFAHARIRSALQGLPAGEKGRGISSVGRNDTPARNPLVLSGIVLAGANVPPQPETVKGQKFDDGILSGDTISQLHLENLDLAVLSACETGLGDVAGGEGVLGLQRAFHMAGAKNVVASLWKVDDRATALLMQLVYYKLTQERKPVAQALREAQLTLYDHPELLELSGELRGRIDFAKTVPVKRNGKEPSPEKRAPPRLWAAFILSGVGK